MKIFISHSSKDKLLAKHLADLIQSTLDLRSEDIRCTSVGGYKLPIGSNPNDLLRTEVSECDILIGLISDSSLESLYVMFELGARWGANKAILPVLTSNLDFNSISEPLRSFHGIKINDPTGLHQLVYQIGKSINVEFESPELVNRKIDDLMELIEPSETSKTRRSLEGVWEGTGRDIEVPNDLEYQIHLEYKARFEFEQSKDQITGIARIYSDRHTTHAIKGELWNDNYFLGTYENQDNNAFDKGVFFLTYSRTGQSMDGYGLGIRMREEGRVLMKFELRKN